MKPYGSTLKTVCTLLLVILLLAEAAGLCFLLSSPAPEALTEPLTVSFRMFGGMCAAGVLLGVFTTVMLKRKTASLQRVLMLSALLVPVSLICARVLFCINYMGKFSVSGSVKGMLYVQNGGWMMWGVFAGAAFSCGIYAKLSKKGTEDPVSAGQLLNMLALPILVFITFERFGEYFTYEGGTYCGRMKLESADSNFCFLPLFSPFIKGGKVRRWDLSVWFFEGLYALAVFTVLLLRRKKTDRPFISILALYSAGQIVFESMLSSDIPKWGAFVKVNMVLSGAVLLALTLIPPVRRKDLKQCLIRTVVCLVLLAVCGTGEWAKDKTGIPDPVIYGIMTLCCGLCAANALAMWRGKKREETEA